MRFKDFGTSDMVLSVWVWVALQGCHPKKKACSDGDVSVRVSLTALLRPQFGMIFLELLLKRMDFPLSCTSNCAAMDTNTF